MELTIEITGDKREDGSIHFSSAKLPGFHLITLAGENPSEVLEPALRLFVSSYVRAKLQQAKPVIKQTSSGFFHRNKAQYDLTAEFCFA